MQSTQQTQNICITFAQHWSNVSDVGPTLYKSYTNVLCLLGIYRNLRKSASLIIFSGTYTTLAK